MRPVGARQTGPVGAAAAVAPARARCHGWRPFSWPAIHQGWIAHHTGHPAGLDGVTRRLPLPGRQAGAPWRDTWHRVPTWSGPAPPLFWAGYHNPSPEMARRHTDQGPRRRRSAVHGGRVSCPEAAPTGGGRWSALPRPGPEDATPLLSTAGQGMPSSSLARSAARHDSGMARRAEGP